jgi:hypothetical protein
MEYLDGRVRICPICNKKFILPCENVYKLIIKGKRKDYCSYTCWMVAQKEQESVKKYRSMK